MRAAIDYRPERQMYNIYLGSHGVAITRDADGRLLVQAIKEGDERPPFLQLGLEEYRAIVDAILTAESPRLAEARLLSDTLADAKEIRDRLLTLVEEGWTA